MNSRKHRVTAEEHIALLALAKTTVIEMSPALRDLKAEHVLPYYDAEGFAWDTLTTVIDPSIWTEVFDERGETLTWYRKTSS